MADEKAKAAKPAKGQQQGGQGKGGQGGDEAAFHGSVAYSVFAGGT